MILTHCQILQQRKGIKRMIDQILKDLESSDSDLISRGLKFSIVSNAYWNNGTLIEQIFQLLFHEEYTIRDKALEVLQFFIQFGSHSDPQLSELLLHVIGNSKFTVESWFRCTKLYILIPNKAIPKENIIAILNSDGNYVQGLITFLIRGNKEYGEVIDAIVDYIVKNDLEVNSDTKKTILWLFWNNSSVVTPQIFDVISRLSIDEDSEVRRLACELLVQIASDSIHTSKILEILEKRIVDESWRVQRVAIKCLLSHTQNLYQEDQGFWIKVVGLFWNTHALVRKNICETLPLWITITEEKNRIFLEMMITALSDENWEVRESVAISLDKYLDLETQYKDILVSILNLTDDSHPEVRKTSCTIISSRINAFESKKEPISRIIDLLKDSSFLVRKEAIKSLNQIMKVVNLNKLYDSILKIILKLLIDLNIEVRVEAWRYLNKLKTELIDAQTRLVLSGMIKFQHPLDDDIRLNICTFLKSYECGVLEKNTGIFSFLLPFLADENKQVLDYSWELCRKVFPNEVRQYVTNLRIDLDKLPPEILKEVYLTSDKLNMLEDDKIMHSEMLTRLELSDDREIQTIILKIFSNYSINYIPPELIFTLIKQGRWDVQEACMPIIIKYITSSEIKDNLRKEFLREIYDLLRNPLNKFQVIDREDMTELLLEMSNFFESKDIEKLSNPLDDDLRFQAWIMLERKLDLLQKVGHPKYNEFTEKFKQTFLPELRKKQHNLNLTKIFNLRDETNIVTEIIHLMHYQQSLLREKLLHLINESVVLSEPSFKQLRKTIFKNLLSDPILKIRAISWKIFLASLLNDDDSQFSDNLSLIVDLLDSKFEDTQIRAFSILLSRIEIQDSSNEWIFNNIVGKLTDPCYFARNQVWNIFKNKINLSFPRYGSIKLKILNLMTNSNLAIRKEAYQFFDLNFNAFSELIDKYSHSYIIKHSIATILGEKGDYEAALELFRANINNRPKKLDSWLGIALIYLFQNQKKALDFLKKLQMQNPLEPVIYELLLECAINRKEQREIELNREIILILKRL
jgi:HEAT repeat protein